MSVELLLCAKCCSRSLGGMNALSRRSPCSHGAKRFWREEMENEQEMKSTRTVPRLTVDAEALGQDWAGELVEQRGPSVTGEERTRGQ